VKTRPGDNLMVHKALDLAEAGDVIVVDAGGDLTNSLIGELMLAVAAKKELGGVVINGAIRDSGAIRAGKFPCSQRGLPSRALQGRPRRDQRPDRDRRHGDRAWRPGYR
jgi:regulator of RNase E activity RraA